MRSIRIIFETNEGSTAILTVQGYSDALTDAATRALISDIVGSGALPHRNGEIIRASRYDVIETGRREFTGAELTA